VSFNAGNHHIRMSDQPLAVVYDYGQLLDALRARVAELSTPMEVVDDVAGLPQRYTSKLLAPCPVKGIGAISMGPLLGALGLRLIVEIDREAFDRIKHQVGPAS
jgi:hypothetical protein